MGEETINIPTSAAVPTAQQDAAKVKRGSGIDPKSLDALLQTGVVVGGTVARQRQASGRSAERQARIAVCGRKPLFGKKKKEEYRKCVERNQGQQSVATRSSDFPSSAPSDDNGNKTMTYVGVGLGVVLLGVVGFILYRKFNK